MFGAKPYTKLIYVASPYSDPNPKVRERRYNAVVLYTAKMSRDNDNVFFSPIAHSHVLAASTKMPSDWQFWGRIDKRFISVMDEVHVLMLPGWEKSVGVKAEIEYASSRREYGTHAIPVKFVEPPADVMEVLAPTNWSEWEQPPIAQPNGASA